MNESELKGTNTGLSGTGNSVDFDECEVRRLDSIEKLWSCGAILTLKNTSNSYMNQNSHNKRMQSDKISALCLQFCRCCER